MEHTTSSLVAFALGIPLLVLAGFSIGDYPRFGLVAGAFGAVFCFAGLRLFFMGASKVAPGAAFDRCRTWGHDYEVEIPGLPAGHTCKNCLARRDGNLLIFSAPREGIPLVANLRFGGFMPAGLLASATWDPPVQLILVDHPGQPTVGYGPGVHMWWAAPLLAQANPQQAAAHTPLVPP